MAKGRKLGKHVATASASASASASMMSLSEDMISEILVKLPVKSLLRFRCVCKSWLDLIESRNFIEMHRKHHSKSNSSILVVRNGGEDGTKCLLSFYCPETLDAISSSPPLEIPHLKFSSLDVCGPCNGLICASDDTNIVLCNPATREFKLLPLSPCLPCPNGSEFNRESIGFGFDNHTNDFKVVTFVHVAPKDNDEDHIVQLEIYNLSTNSWEAYVWNNFPQHIERGRCGTLYEGSFYWIACKCDEICILSYDMSEDEFMYMPLPDEMFDSDEMDEDDCQRCIRVINDCLAVLRYTEPYIEEHMFVQVWVMHKLGVSKSITKEFKVGPLTGMREPLSIWKNEAILMDTQGSQLVSCALDTHQVTEFDIHACTSQTMLYQESLVSFNN